MKGQTTYAVELLNVVVFLGMLTVLFFKNILCYFDILEQIYIFKKNLNALKSLSSKVTLLLIVIKEKNLN